MKQILYIALLLSATCRAQTVPPIPFGGPQDTGVYFVPVRGSQLLVYTNHKLTVTSVGGRRVAVANKGVSSSSAQPLVYWYVVVNSGTHPNVGIANASVSVLSTSLGDDANAWSYLTHLGSPYKNHSAIPVSYGVSYTAGDTANIALNMTTGKIWFGKNSVYNGDPIAGTGEAYSGITGTIYPAVGEYGGNAFSCTLYSSSYNGSPGAPYVTISTH